MVQSIRHRRGAQSQPRAMPPQVEKAAPETAALSRFEAIVPWYHGRVLEALDSQSDSVSNDEEVSELVSTIVHRLETAPDAPPIGGTHGTLAMRLVDKMHGLGLGAESR